MKEFLNKLIKSKEKRAAELREKIKMSESADEVRELGKTLESVLEELKEAKEELARSGNDGDDGNGGDGGDSSNPQNRSKNLVNVQRVNGNILASYNLRSDKILPDEILPDDGDPTNTVEYRTAFMRYVCRNEPMPAAAEPVEAIPGNHANTLTSDVGAAIPPLLINKIIEKMDNVGMILPLINKTSYQAGIEIPTSTIKPKASWVSEGKGSDRQKKTLSKITFTYHKLRCEISMSMEVKTMALSTFEAKFVENVTKAMIKGIENSVINGTGSGQPKGILSETAPAGQSFTLAKLTYKDLVSFESAVPQEYETTALWCMNKKMFGEYLGITDSNGQPIARVNYGIAGKPERTILGRDVVISPYVSDGKAFIFDFGDYTLNTIYDMGISKKQDWDTEDYLTKAVMSVDGKATSKDSLVTVTISG